MIHLHISSLSTMITYHYYGIIAENKNDYVHKSEAQHIRQTNDKYRAITHNIFPNYAFLLQLGTL